MNTTIGILGNDFNLTTKFIEKIIINTKALTDQEHIKMNIIINNYLLRKNNTEIDNLLNMIIESKIDYLVLTFEDKELYKKIKNKGIKIINESFDINDKELIKKVITLCGKEVIE